MGEDFNNSKYWVLSINSSREVEHEQFGTADFVQYVVRPIFLQMVIWNLLVLFSLTNCKKNDQSQFDDAQLKGQWQYYEGFTDGQPHIWSDQGDPILILQFYDIDSVEHFGLKGTYRVNEVESEIVMFFDDLTRILEVLKLDRDLLWTMQLSNDDHALEMHYHKIR